MKKDFTSNKFHDGIWPPIIVPIDWELNDWEAAEADADEPEKPPSEPPNGPPNEPPKSKKDSEER